MSRETCRVRTQHRERWRRSSLAVRALLAMGMPCLTEPSEPMLWAAWGQEDQGVQHGWGHLQPCFCFCRPLWAQWWWRAAGCALVEARKTKPAFPCGCPPVPLPRGRLPCPPLGLSGVFFLFLPGVMSELLPVISFPFNKRGWKHFVNIAEVFYCSGSGDYKTITFWLTNAINVMKIPLCFTFHCITCLYNMLNTSD